MKELVMGHPPDANDCKAHSIAQELWSHLPEACRQSLRNVGTGELWNLNLKYEKSYYNREYSVTERLNPGDGHRSKSKRPCWQGLSLHECHLPLRKSASMLRQS